MVLSNNERVNETFYQNETFEIFSDEENSEVEPLGMPVGVRIFWDMLFGSSILISVLGNVSVLWTIIGKSLYTGYAYTV